MKKNKMIVLVSATILSIGVIATSAINTYANTEGKRRELKFDQMIAALDQETVHQQEVRLGSWGEHDDHRRDVGDRRTDKSAAAWQDTVDPAVLVADSTGRERNPVTDERGDAFAPEAFFGTEDVLRAIGVFRRVYAALSADQPAFHQKPSFPGVWTACSGIVST